MSLNKIPGLLTVLVGIAACNEAPTEPTPLAVAGPSFGVEGGGAFVDHFSDTGLILLTIDPETGLNSVHYTDSDQLGAFLSGEVGFECTVPEYFGAIRGLFVATPSGQLHVGGNGEAYVLVVPGAGFPANLCGESMAEGTVGVQIRVHPATGGASFSSNGVITLNADDSGVRLHMSRKGLGAPVGTVRVK